MTDRLQIILQRALHRAETTRQAKRKIKKKKKNDAEREAEDHARRLAERHRLRRLLADDFDGMRFRWFFTKIQNDTPLEELRVWIDRKILEEDSRAKVS